MNITIVAKRWFDNDGCANVYHSSTTLINGEIVDSVDPDYGSGDQYRISAFASLIKKGILEKHNLPNPNPSRSGGFEPIHIWAERAGVKMNYLVSDVANESDL